MRSLAAIILLASPMTAFVLNGYMDADERKKELMAQNEIDGFMFKMENDPRILPGVGHFIRKTSLDEFPQFFNVLRGEHSIFVTTPINAMRSCFA